MSANIWGPKIHRLDGVWYIYFSAGSTQDPFKVQIYVLSNHSDDPLTGEWKEEGRLVTSNDSFAFNPNVFEHLGRRYLIWSQTFESEPGRQGPPFLFIAPMASPTKLGGPEAMIATPTRYGPGLASFTEAEDGETDVMLYHAREYRDLHGNELIDPNRHTRARILLWDQEGWPEFENSRTD